MSDPKQPSELHFHYIKGATFRAVHADGAIGGPTPRGGFHVAFFSERAPIPNETVHRFSDDGVLGEEDRSRRISKEGLVRDMQVDVYMSLETAEIVTAWMVEHLITMRAAAEKAASAKKK